MAFTPRTYTRERDLRQALADIRRSGYAISDRQIHPEYVSVAAPVHGPANTVAAALSLIVPHTESHGPSLVHLVQATARGISRALGAGGSQNGTQPSSAIRKNG
jgi:DNA-binding IclR family transcriptional regulator